MKTERLIGGNLESNGYIVSDASGVACYIVDPGYNGERFLKRLREEKLNLLGILLTHNHYDHVGAVRRIKSEIDCPVYLHANDAAAYKDADSLLKGGETLALGAESLTVLHTPGHTRGSACFYAEREKICFTGDTIFNVDLGRTDLDDGSEAEMARSVRDVIAKWPSDVVIYPGHGDPCNMKFVRTHNGEYLEIMGERDKFKAWKGEKFIL